ncbi:MAG: large-conductance mechanosensitive channel protein MscL [Bacteroidota bacterium]
MLNEFKQFAMRGSVVDMGVGIIIGAAFGKITSSFVNDVLMPPIGLLVGGVDFSNLALTLKEADGAAAVTLKYGFFFNTVLDFMIVAFALFLLIRMMNRLTRTAEAPVAPTTKECPECRMSIPVTAKRCGHCTSVLHS